MKGIDHFSLDGHLLRLLVAVHEEGSVTRAAERLGLTQSAVSHGLDRLRAVCGDALFVKAGRGIVPTAQAAALAERARALLSELRAFSLAAGFSPQRLHETFTIAANDLQRDLLAPPLLRRLQAEAPGVALRLIASNAPEPALLRDDGCHLLITPRPPDATDLVHKRLFTDRYRVFHDATQVAAPRNLADYTAAAHVSVLYEPRRMLDIDQWLLTQGVRRRIVASVPGMAALGALLRGGPWLATVPSLLGRGALAGLNEASPPLNLPPLVMFAVWHQRHQADPVQRWLRGHLMAVVAQLGLQSGAAAPARPAARPRRQPARRGRSRQADTS